MEGELNANLYQPKGHWREDEIAAALTALGLEDISSHFLLRRCPWYWDGSTWKMVLLGREVQSRTDYILGTDRRLFSNVAVRYPRHNLDHYMVLGFLPITPLREHTEYLGRRTWLPLRPPTTLTREDRLFVALWKAIPKSKSREARKNVWIPVDTWMFV